MTRSLACAPVSPADADTNEIIDSDDPTRMRSTQDIRQLMPTCFDRIDRDVSIFAWGNPWSIPNDTMTYFKPRGIATTDDMAATMFELMSLAETADQYEEPCVSSGRKQWGGGEKTRTD